MIRTLTWKAARAIMGLAIAILPASRRPDWRDAMLAEFLHLHRPDQALAFAAGCLRASIAERNSAMSIFHRALHLGGFAIPAHLALVAFWSASNLAGAGSTFTAVFVLLGVVYAGVAGWTLFRPDHALVRSASIALAICVALFAVTRLPLGLAQERLYDALIFESMAIWVVLLGLGVALRRYAAAPVQAN